MQMINGKHSASGVADSGSMSRLATSLAGGLHSAASRIDERGMKGVQSVSQMTHHAADRVEQLADYVNKQGERACELASSMSERARQSPGTTLLIAGLAGFAMGLFCSATLRRSYS